MIVFLHPDPTLTFFVLNDPICASYSLETIYIYSNFSIANVGLPKGYHSLPINMRH